LGKGKIVKIIHGVRKFFRK